MKTSNVKICYTFNSKFEGTTTFITGDAYVFIDGNVTLFEVIAKAKPCQEDVYSVEKGIKIATLKAKRMLKRKLSRYMYDMAQKSLIESQRFLATSKALYRDSNNIDKTLDLICG